MKTFGVIISLLSVLVSFPESWPNKTLRKEHEKRTKFKTKN